MVRTLFAAGVVLCLGATGQLLAGDGGNENQVLKMLSSKKQEDRDKAYALLSASRKKRIAELIGIVKNPQLRKDSPDPVLKAATLLGEMRATEAVPALVEIHFLRHAPNVEDAFRFKDHPTEYPVVGALIRIGKPSVMPLLEKLRTDPKNALLGLSFMIVLHDVEGPEAALARLKRFRAKSKSQEEGKALAEVERRLKQSLRK